VSVLHPWKACAALFVTLACLLPEATQANQRPVPSVTVARAKPTPTKTSVTTPAKPKTTVLRLADTVGPRTDPALVSDEENVELANLLYSGLVRLDASYHVVPADASRIALSPNHRQYTFYLRSGLRFSNGDPVTAEDYKFAIVRSLNASVKSSTAPVYLFDIQGAGDFLTGKAKTVSGIKVINSRTLQITTRWPVPYFLMELTYPTSYALDEKAIRKLGPIDNTAWYSSPVGSGPYKLKSWSPNSKMVLVPNKYFAGHKPTVKEIVVSLGSLQGSGMDLYNYVRQTLDVANLSYDRTLLGQPGIRETLALIIDGIYMNVRMAPFGDKRVRRALTMAINRTSLISASLGKTVTPFGGYVPSGEAGYDPSLKLLPYNATEARAELKAAGFPGGKGFPATTLYYPSSPTLAKLVQAVATQWHKVLHISIDTKGLEENALLTKQAQNSLPLYLSGWTADYPDPHDWLSEQWKSDAINNNIHYSNKMFDDAVAAADVTWDVKRRNSLYGAAQEMLVQDAAWLPLYIPHRLTYIRPTVDNLYLTGYGVLPRTGSWAEVAVSTSASTARRTE
jgi:ABC-type oligopeptide transport system substrate-binding subunit